MRHLFIVNPVAGGRHNRHSEIMESIRTEMDRRSEPYEIYVTKAPMDACDKISLAAADTTPLRVYACGGDGTLNESVNGVAGHRHAAVTHYPYGTGNDFIKMFGSEDAKRFIDLPALLGGFSRPVDLIEVRADQQVRRIGLNICSVGIDARIGTDVHKYSGMPILGGPTGYVVSMAVNLIKGVNQRYRITAGGVVTDGSFALVCACNGRFYGGGFNPVPEAQPDDGVLEYLIVNAVSRLKFLRVVLKYAKGKYREISEIITHIRGHHIHIEGGSELVINVDGELMRAKEVSFTLIPRGIDFIFPSGLRFFEENDIKTEVFVNNSEI